jgi:hypothetical protein
VVEASDLAQSLVQLIALRATIQMLLDAGEQRRGVRPGEFSIYVGIQQLEAHGAGDLFFLRAKDGAEQAWKVRLSRHDVSSP